MITVKRAWFFTLFLILTAGCAKEDMSASSNNFPSSLIRVELSLSDVPVVGQTSVATVSITNIDDLHSAGNISAYLLVPDGFSIVSGKSSWKGVLNARETVEFSSTLKLLKPGNWTVAAIASGGSDFLSVVADENSANLTSDLFQVFPNDYDVSAEMSKDFYWLFNRSFPEINKSFGNVRPRPTLPSNQSAQRNQK